MNRSRSTSQRLGETSSIDALSRTIEGLEARIEGLMGGSAHEPQHEPRDLRNGRAGRPQAEMRPPEANGSHERKLARDPLAAIRERQRVLDAGRAERVQPVQATVSEPLREESRAPRFAESRRSEPRPPEAFRPATQHATAIAAPPRANRPAPRMAMAGTTAAAAPSDSSMRDIADALVGLRQQLKQDISEGVAREMSALRAEIRSIKSVAEEQDFAADLRSDLSRLADSINQLGHQAAPEAAELRSEFEELRSAMSGLAREDSVLRMESRWQDMEERIQDTDTNVLREELVALAYRIEDIKNQLGAMADNPVIHALEQKLINVAGAMEQLGSRMQPTDATAAEQFALLDERLDEISRAIAAGSRASAAASMDQSVLQRLDGRIGAIAEQIDAMSHAAQSTSPTDALSYRIEALTSRIEELADEQAAMRLEERLDQLSAVLQQTQKPVQMPDLSVYLADISRKIDSLDQGAVSDVLAERLDYLASRIDEIELQPRQQSAVDERAFGRIEDRLSDIATRLDEAAAAPRGDDDALRNLEDQIAHLSTLITQPSSGMGGMPAEFEHRMTAIEGHMATNDEYIIEAARQAAEAVVEAYSHNAVAGASVGASDMAALAALADDLRHLEDLTRSSEERTHHTFEALHGTLVQIADRLDGMEHRLTAAPVSAQMDQARAQAQRSETRRPEPVQAAPSMPLAAQLSVAQASDLLEREMMVDAPARPRPQPAASGENDGRYALAQPEAAVTARASEEIKAPKPSLLQELSRRFLPTGKAEAAGQKPARAVVEPTPPLDPSQSLPAGRENDLLEPGSGAPDVKKILERVRASQAAGEFEGDRASSSERADYIAAARRAAKAAAQETDPQANPLKGPRRTAKASGGTGLGAKFAQHRRPIMMAVGAVLLVLMAMPLVKTLTSGETAPAATIEAPAKREAPADMTGNAATTPSASNQAFPSDTAQTPAGQPAEPMAQELAQEPAPAQDSLANQHLTDPKPAEGQAAAMAPAGVAPQAQEAFVAAPKAEAEPQITVPAGLEPKSLADAATAGDANALFEIGARFTDGRGVKSDLTEAAKWYKLSADKGLATAQYRLANLLEKGTGVGRDLGKAVTYYKQAAEAGNASAMHNLAVLYASGAAGQPDYAAAVNWFSRAADLGVADSQFNLAILYARGNGVRQDLEESYKWFAVAAKGGDKDAAQKRDEVANAMRKEQLESARAKADGWKAKTLDPKANAVNLPEEWASGKTLTTASVDMDKAIRNIQAILNKSGFDAGTADGKIGQKTVTAIKAFQTSVGQEPTGKINDALVKELLARNK
jgi:localization factor PodJL